MVPSYDSLIDHLFLLSRGVYMEQYKMTDVWKMKLRELHLMETEMKMDKKTTKEELDDIKAMIEYVKKEYKEELLNEKENNDGKKI